MNTFINVYRYGDRSPEIAQYREKLTHLSFSLGTAPNVESFDKDMVTALLQFQTQNIDLYNTPLATDAILGPITQHTINKFLIEDKSEVQDEEKTKILTADAGTAFDDNETPNWSNRIRDILAYTGVSTPVPWAAAYVSWKLHELGLKSPETCYFTQFVNWFEKRDLLLLNDAAVLVVPKQNWTFHIWYPNLSRIGHVGLVVGYRAGYVTTLEAQVNVTTVRISYGVAVRHRKLNTIHSFGVTV